MKYLPWLGWVLFLISCVCEGYFFIVDYKKPITMKNEVDSVKISYMIEKEHENKNIKEIRLGGDFPVTGLLEDVIKLKSPDANLDKVKSVFYAVETDTTLEHYVTLFEVEYDLFNEKVGKKLITCRNYFFGLNNINDE
jgi:hypothetical protein